MRRDSRPTIQDRATEAATRAYDRDSRGEGTEAGAISESPRGLWPGRLKNPCKPWGRLGGNLEVVDNIPMPPSSGAPRR